MLLLKEDQENKISFCVYYINEPPLYQLKTFFTGIEAIYNKIARSYKKKLMDEDRLKIQQISLKSPLIIDLLGDPFVVSLSFLIIARLFNKLDQIKNQRNSDKKFLEIKDLMDKDKEERYKSIINQSIRKKAAQKITIKFKDIEITITSNDYK